MRVRGERLKTINAHRTIPVHPELQRLGFLRFVEQQRQAGTGFLFPLQEPNKREQWAVPLGRWFVRRSEEHTSELQSLMRISYAVFCLKKKTKIHHHCKTTEHQHRNPNNNT